MIVGADAVRYVFSAGGVIVIFLVISLRIFAAGRTSAIETVAMRQARRALLTAALAFTLFSMWGFEYLVARTLVGSLKPLKAGDIVSGKRTALVILGSGGWLVEDWDGNTRAYPDRASAARVLEAARVFRLVQPAVVVSSGGNPHPSRRMVPSGDEMREGLIGLGVPADRIIVETASQTTRDEAVVVDSMLKAQSIEQVIVVTSETHMRRALGAFRSVGIPAIPAIAPDIRREDASWADLVLPSEEGLGLGSINAHELLGISYYWLRGWHK